MLYKNWVETVPNSITKDPLWNMLVYRYAMFLAEICWEDVTKLSRDKLLVASSDQLYRSACSVSANIAEGYSRKSKLDQARFYEYALGSARECRGWYFNSRHKLSEKILESRLALLTQIIKMLLNIVPKTRNNKIKEPGEIYGVSVVDIEKFEFPMLN